jgi:hypothetical protein
MISIATGAVVDLRGILAAYKPRSAGELLMVVRLLPIIVFSPAGEMIVGVDQRSGAGEIDGRVVERTPLPRFKARSLAAGQGDGAIERGRG